jgi:DNA-binding transcriptional regulator YdaS (Cro superfamily)
LTIKTLIDKAAKQVQTRYKLAQALGVTPGQVYDWQTGRKPCSPADQARIAAIANEDPIQQLVRATLEQTEGTLRGEQLKTALGKWLPQTGAGSVSGLFVAAMAALGMALSGDSALDLLRCIKRSKSIRRYLTIDQHRHFEPLRLINC